jgi:hypothetical protein
MKITAPQGRDPATIANIPPAAKDHAESMAKVLMATKD